MPPGRRRVFISYAHKDGAELAQRLRTDLEKHELEPWLDKRRLTTGASWSVEIELALDRCDVVLALLSKGSFVSDICRAEQLRSLRRGKPVFPILVQSDADRPLHLETKQFLDFSNALDHAEHLRTLLDDIASGAGASLPAEYRKTYVTVPPLPGNFVPRPEVLESLRLAVMAEGTANNMAVATLRAMGGAGKTVMAQALCHDDVIQVAFPDGVIWLTIGQEHPDLISIMREAAKVLGDPLNRYDTLEGATNQLRTTLQEKAALLVLDDVWDVTHASPFRAEAPRSRLFITTRDSRIATALGAREVPLGLLTEEQALQVLSNWSQQSVESLTPEAHTVTEECGHLPLALAMMGAMVKGKPDRWGNVLHKLRRVALDKIKYKLPDYLHHRTLLAAIDVSVNALSSPEHKRHYLELCVFPKKTPIYETTLQVLWGLDSYDTEDLVDELTDLSLAERDDERRVAFHDLQLDYARAETGQGNLANAHAALVRSILGDAQTWGGVDWTCVDDYVLRYVGHHVACAAGVLDDRLGIHALLCQGLLAERRRRTGTDRLFADDAIRAFETASGSANPNYVRMVRASLIHSMLGVSSATTPGEWYALQVLLGRSREAADSAALLSDTGARAYALAEIAIELSKGRKTGEALEFTRLALRALSETGFFGWMRLKTLVLLAPIVAVGSDEDVEKAVALVSDDLADSRVEVLSTLVVELERTGKRERLAPLSQLCFEAASSIHPNHAARRVVSFARAGLALTKAGRMGHAVAAIQQAEREVVGRLDSDDYFGQEALAALTVVAESWLEAGDAARASACFDHVITNSNSSSTQHNAWWTEPKTVASLLRTAAELGQGGASLRRAIDFLFDCSRVLSRTTLTGAAAAVAGIYGAGGVIALNKRARSLPPESAALVLSESAHAFLILDRQDEASTAARLAAELSLESGNPSILVASAFACVQAGALEEAEALSDGVLDRTRGIERDSTEIEAICALARVLVDSDRSRDAVKLLDSAYELAKTLDLHIRPVSQAKIASIFLHVGSEARAREIIYQAADIALGQTGNVVLGRIVGPVARVVCEMQDWSQLDTVIRRVARMSDSDRAAAVESILQNCGKLLPQDSVLELVEIVASFNDDFQKRELAGLIAEVAGSRHLDEPVDRCLDFVRSMDHRVYRAGALSRIAVSGVPDRADVIANLVDEAETLLGNRLSSETYALEDIAIGNVAAGDVSRAVQLVGFIEEEPARTQAWRRLCSMLADMDHELTQEIYEERVRPVRIAGADKVIGAVARYARRQSDTKLLEQCFQDALSSSELDRHSALHAVVPELVYHVKGAPGMISQAIVSLRRQERLWPLLSVVDVLVSSERMDEAAEILIEAFELAVRLDRRAVFQALETGVPVISHKAGANALKRVFDEIMAIETWWNVW
jgi:tetratricopeptide (TPR) repeat protein